MRDKTPPLPPQTLYTRFNEKSVTKCFSLYPRILIQKYLNKFFDEKRGLSETYGVFPADFSAFGTRMN